MLQMYCTGPHRASFLEHWAHRDDVLPTETLGHHVHYSVAGEVYHLDVKCTGIRTVHEDRMKETTVIDAIKNQRLYVSDTPFLQKYSGSLWGNCQDRSHLKLIQTQSETVLIIVDSVASNQIRSGLGRTRCIRCLYA